MIFFISDGRLGNEIFQYAFLKAHARKKEIILALKMEKLLSVLEIDNSKLICPNISRYTSFFIKEFLVKMLEVFVKLKIISGVEQNRLNGMPDITVSKRKGVLPITFVKTGFFQSEKMFNTVVLDFKIQEAHVLKANKILSNIGEFDFVFVHVRRGDYIFESFNGKCGIDLPKKYFERAMHEVSRGLTKPYFIFLTDDYNYVECCFSNINNKYISKENMATDLALMASCQYGVTSNSSFSWWGAYLMSNRKMVVYPKYWYGWKSKIESHPGIQPSWGTIIEPID
jgi:hypothetical protein